MNREVTAIEAGMAETIKQLEADKAELVKILGGAQFLIQCLASKLDLSYGMEQQISEFMRDYESVTAKHGSDK